MTTGSLQEKNGKYYAVINITDINGKRIKQKWISSNLAIKGNKKKAEQFLRDTIKEYDKKMGIVDCDILFSDYIISWLESAKLKIDIITYKGYLNIAKSQVIPFFKERGTKLNKLSRKDIQDYINEKYENGKKNVSIMI